jgi:hypothetical protein
MTEEDTPTPMPARIATGSLSAGTAAQPASGVTTTSATIIAAASPSTPFTSGSEATRWAKTM